MLGLAAALASFAVLCAAIAATHRIDESQRLRRGRVIDDFTRPFVARRSEYTAIGWRWFVAGRVLGILALVIMLFVFFLSD
jgi:hypothetical protein